jgi:hypothetical protein
MRLLGVHDQWLVTPSRSDPDVVIGRFGRPLVHGPLRPDPVFRAQAGLRRPARRLLVQREQDACGVAATYQKGVAGVPFGLLAREGVEMAGPNRDDARSILPVPDQDYSGTVLYADVVAPDDEAVRALTVGHAVSLVRDLW